MKRTIVIAACVTLLAFVLAGCAGPGDTEPTGNPPGTTDEMWSDSQSGAELEVFRQDGKVYTVGYEYEIPELAGYEELEEGKRYIVVADVTFLNGGVAGYVDYPQVERIISIEEASSEAG